MCHSQGGSLTWSDVGIRNSVTGSSDPDINTQIMTLTMGGNVGIGTTSSEARLDAAGNVNTTQWVVQGCVNPVEGGRI